MAIMLYFAAAVAGPFTCTPVAVHDGEWPVWCREGPQVRLAGIVAREIDETCRRGHPCPAASDRTVRDMLVRLLGGARGRDTHGHVLVAGPRLRCVGFGSAKGRRTAARCRMPNGRTFRAPWSAAARSNAGAVGAVTSSAADLPLRASIITCRSEGDTTSAPSAGGEPDRQEHGDVGRFRYSERADQACPRAHHQAQQGWTGESCRGQDDRYADPSHCAVALSICSHRDAISRKRRSPASSPASARAPTLSAIHRGASSPWLRTIAIASAHRSCSGVMTKA